MNAKQIKLTFLLLISGIASAQVGIGTQIPDISSILDLTSSSQGLLTPRMSESDRDAILLPAKGLIIYNTTTNTLDINIGTPLLIVWDRISASSSGSSATYFSVNASDDIRTVASNDVAVPEMSIIPGAGSYAVTFNGQYNSAPFNYDVNITEQSKLDLIDIYNKLLNTPTTVFDHAGVYGNNEILTSGVYKTDAATKIAGTLTLNGNGNPNSIFIFKIGAAFTSAASSKVILANAASACNVFWVVEGAASMGASTDMKGMLIGHNGAVSLAAGCTLVGRMFSTTGAISTDGSTVSIPNDCTYIDLGVLSNFALYSSEGAITNTGTSSVTGDIGTNLGLISGFAPGAIIGNTYENNSPLVNISKNVLSTFSVFQNGSLVPNSSRTRRSKTPTEDITLQAIATVLDGQAIDVRWKTDVSELQLVSRIMTLIKVK